MTYSSDTTQCPALYRPLQEVPVIRINRNSYYPPFESVHGDVNVVVRDGD